MSRRLIAVTAVAVLCLVPVAAALAKAPKRGTYSCTQEFALKPQTLKIKKKKKYSYSTNTKHGQHGKGKFKTKGHKIKFKTGILHELGVTGKIGKTAAGKPQIILHASTSGTSHDNDQTCVKG